MIYHAFQVKMSAMNKPENSRKRKQFSIKDKIDIIDQVKNGKSRSAVTKEFSVPEATLRGWLKDEDRLRSSLSEMDNPEEKRKRLRGAQDKELDKAVMTWFTQARTEGTPISGPNIQHQAQKYHSMLHPTDDSFKSSAGWLRNFKVRHGIQQVTIRGEQCSADEEAAQAYPEELKKMLEDGGFLPEQVYNCDETGLYFKMLPDKTLAQKTDDNKTLGFKQCKNRLTALLCCNSTGSHKLQPLIIGKFENPRCLHHVNRKTLQTIYDHSSNAWMTAAIFEDWFHKNFVPAVKKHLRKKKLPVKAVLLVDNCGAHPKDLKSRDGRITVWFLPKNTTSKIQPCDMGIISTTKRNYRRNLVTAIIDSNLNLQDYLKSLTIKDAMHLFATAWDAVSAESINACWRKGLGDTFQESVQDSDSDGDFDGFDETDLRDAESRAQDYEGFNECDMVTARRALGHVTEEAISTWLSIDNDEPTSPVLTDSEIVDSVTSTTTATTQPEDEDDDDADYEPTPAMSEVVKGLQVGLRWLEASDRSTAVEVTHLRNILHRAKAEARESCRQTMLTDFFFRN